jgi:hypothetical protein
MNGAVGHARHASPQVCAAACHHCEIKIPAGLAGKNIKTMLSRRQSGAASIHDGCLAEEAIVGGASRCWLLRGRLI